MPRRPTKLVTATATATAAQQWTAANGALVNAGSGKCLDATGQSSANGTRLQLWSCTGAANQAWTLPGGGAPPTTPPAGGLDGRARRQLRPVDPAAAAAGRLARRADHDPVLAAARGGRVHEPGVLLHRQDRRLDDVLGPGEGVTTPNSTSARSELREMNRDGSAADWRLAGAHRMSATLRIPTVTKNVCVGQVHLGTGGPSTKPLLELYYRPNGDIYLGTENSPTAARPCTSSATCRWASPGPT